MASKRDLQALRQTDPALRGKRGGVPRPPEAFEKQMAPIIESMKAEGTLTEPVRSMLMATPQDQVHHIDGLEIIDAIFQNNSPSQDRELRAMSPGGNDIRNFMIMPERAHQGKNDEYNIKSVHQTLRALGLENDSKALNPLLAEIARSADAPFARKKELYGHYIKSIQPHMVEAIDDAILDYETRFAGQIMGGVLDQIRRK